MPRGGKKPKFKAVLFDLDGTLIEFKFKFKESRIAIINWLRGTGFDTSKISPEMKTQGIFDAVKRELDGSKGATTFSSLKRSMCDILDHFELKSLAESAPHPGALDLLKHLKYEHILAGLVTNSGRRPIDSILEKYGFLHYLSPIVSRDEMERMKPEPDGILNALEILSIERKDSVYVGDSVIDIQAAKSAGISCIALSQGMTSGRLLAKEEPEYLISRIEEVEDVVFS